MSGLDAKFYRHESKKCEKAAAQARDAFTKEYWIEAARRWLTLANQADIAATFLKKRRHSE
jgi:uncharacterized alpha-E superfamily protein